MVRKRKGFIFRKSRAGAAYGSWILRYKINGQVFQESLHTSVKSEAVTAQKRIMEELQGQEQERLLRGFERRVEGIRWSMEELRMEKSLLIEDAWEAYRGAGNRSDVGASTLKLYERYWGCFERWCASEFPRVERLREVDFEVASAYKMSFSEKTGRTWNAHRNFLSSFWRIVEAKAMWESNPWLEVTARKHRASGRRALTLKELGKLVSAAEGERRVVIVAAIYTGARLGDACTLRWEMFDRKTNLLKFVPAKTERTSGEVILIPIHPSVLRVLDEHTGGKWPKKGLITKDIANMYGQRGPNAASRYMAEVFEKIGLRTVADEKTGRMKYEEGVGFHSLRHSFVSLLAAGGAAVSISKAAVGHSSNAVHEIYTHVDMVAVRRAVDGLPDLQG